MLQYQIHWFCIPKRLHWRSSSTWAKNSLASFRISLARRSSLTSPLLPGCAVVPTPVSKAGCRPLLRLDSPTPARSWGCNQSSEQSTAALPQERDTPLDASPAIALGEIVLPAKTLDSISWYPWLHFFTLYSLQENRGESYLISLPYGIAMTENPPDCGVVQDSQALGGGVVWPPCQPLPGPVPSSPKQRSTPQEALEDRC